MQQDQPQQSSDWTKNLALIAALAAPIGLGMIHMGGRKPSDALRMALQQHAVEGAEQGGGIPLFRAMSKEPAKIVDLEHLHPIARPFTPNKPRHILDIAMDRAKNVEDKYPEDKIYTTNVPLMDSLSAGSLQGLDRKPFINTDYFQPGLTDKLAKYPNLRPYVQEFHEKLLGRFSGQEDEQAVAYRRLLEMLSGGL